MSASTSSCPSKPHDPEVRLERRERIVGDLGLRRAHRRDQRRLPRVGEADQRGVGEELHLELQPVLLAVLALLREARRAARVREEAGVARARPRRRERRRRCRRGARGRRASVRHACFTTVPSGTGTTRSTPRAPWRLLAGAVRPRLGASVRVVPEREQRRDVAVGLRGSRRRPCRRRRRRDRPWARGPRAGTTSPRPRRPRHGG